ncbi:MAG: helix-turn-helix domain-containing protein [Acidiferrobacterales bacterium]|nr:helix-turn-helix domain-containing protein [Acidiferrobacterales bacterium]
METTISSNQEEILNLIDKLVASGALGRSPVYEKLLKYFAEQNTHGKACSEFSIAVDVFEKDQDYDITADSTVRVYIYNLRKKLETYYQDLGKNETLQLYIPKGEYRLLVRNTKADDSTNLIDETNQTQPLSSAINTEYTEKTNSFSKLKFGSFILLAMLATALCTAWLLNPTDRDETDFSEQQLNFWGGILNDNKPIMIVVGDYFIFAEEQDNTNEIRLVREFDVNSAQDFLRKTDKQSDDLTTNRRYDLGLTYLPRGSAFALARVQQLLGQANKTPRISMMSELSADDIRANHIIYIGYLSGLGVLEGYVFANSRFEIGDSYDDLIDTQTLTYYRSDFIEATEDRNFTDFGTISSFSLAANNQIVAITGTRDAGLMEMSEVAIANDLLDRMQLTTEGGSAYEALFEVDGFNLTNISSELIISGYMFSDE